MTITRQEKDKMAVLLLSGHLDKEAASQLRRALSKEEALDIVLDFSELDEISAAGLRVILSSFKKLQPKGGRVAIQNASRHIGKVLDDTGLSEILAVNKEN